MPGLYILHVFIGSCVFFLHMWCISVDVFKNMVVYGCEHCTGAGETCIGSGVAEARAA